MSRDEREFLAMFEAHGGVLLATLRRLCGNPHDAADLFQETAVRVWRNFGRRPTLRSPRGWLLTIGYRAFLDDRRRAPNHDCLVDPVDQRVGSPVRQAERAEWQSRVNAAIDRLEPVARQVVVLHYTGGLTLRQTAVATGLPVGTVKSRLNAALNKLRSVLE